MLAFHRVVLLSALAAMPLATAGGVEVASPDGELVVTVELEEGQPVYSANWRGEPLIPESANGLVFGSDTEQRWTIESEQQVAHDHSWKPVMGKRATVRDNHRECSLFLESGSLKYALIFRVFDDGFAIRYTIPAPTGAGARQVAERTEFRFAGDPGITSHIGEWSPETPVPLGEIGGRLAPPVLAKFADGRYAAIHEADLRESAPLMLRAESGVLKADGELTPAARQTPWRVIQVGESLAELVDSDILTNLNPRADANDFAWVKPGVALWDWRSWGYRAPDGFEYGLNLESWKRFIDFAAEHDVPYVLLDANWYGPEHRKSSNPFSGGVVADVRRAIDYGKQRDVELILYLNDVAGTKYGIEEILRTWSGWGAAGIKYGFMKNRSPANKVAWTRKIVELCAENRLLINFHDGPVPPAGCEATFPNWVTREFCHAQSDASRAFTPTGFLMQMAVNQLAGPIDMTNGMFDLSNSVAERPRVFVEVPATITAEAARTLIVYSGMTVIPDAPPVYARHPELFRFISAQKMPWADSRTIDFQFGESITVMRQTGENYLVASATNDRARTLSIPLDFLPAGKGFTALVCEDGPDAHFQSNREACTTRTVPVDSTKTIAAKLAPGGGHCVLITPVGE